MQLDRCFIGNEYKDYTHLSIMAINLMVQNTDQHKVLDLSAKIEICLCEVTTKKMLVLEMKIWISKKVINLKAIMDTWQVFIIYEVGIRFIIYINGQC